MRYMQGRVDCCYLFVCRELRGGRIDRDPAHGYIVIDPYAAGERPWRLHADPGGTLVLVYEVTVVPVGRESTRDTRAPPPPALPTKRRHPRPGDLQRCPKVRFGERFLAIPNNSRHSSCRFGAARKNFTKERRKKMEPKGGVRRGV